jgi:alpha-ketoglutarate-dependent taurine dioxygenase
MMQLPARVDPLPDTTTLAARVLRDGWLLSTVTAMGHDIGTVSETIARQLGEPVLGRGGQTIESLTPVTQPKANAKSLSVLHGHGSFPMHTDGAHRLRPPRFVILVCASPGATPVPTTLQRFRDLRVTAAERARLEAAPFLVRNGRRSFYSTVCSPARPFIRFDAACMVPQDAESQASACLIARCATEGGVTSVHWRIGDVLIIDNWNVLHGRGHGSGEASPGRKLLRVSVQ